MIGSDDPNRRDVGSAATVYRCPSCGSKKPQAEGACPGCGFAPVAATVPDEKVVRADDGSGDRIGVMLRVAGKTFACECGANVFSKVDGEYRCNGCDRRYV